MSDAPAPTVQTIGRDTTIRLSCRAKDWLLWMRCRNLFGGHHGDPNVVDFWRLKAGDFVTITNRWDDLPTWFELHPTEACNRLIPPMQAKLKSGWKPDDICTAPNLWRVQAGDRLAWARSPETRNRQTGFLDVFEFHANALAYADSSRTDFNAFDCCDIGNAGQEPEAVQACQAAIAFVRQMGIPRTFSAGEWGLG